MQKYKCSFNILFSPHLFYTDLSFDMQKPSHTSNGSCRREEKSCKHWSLFTMFLGATKHLYNWLCPLVCRSVGWSGNAFVRRSTRHTLLAYLALFCFFRFALFVRLRGQGRKRERVKNFFLIFS